MSIKRYVRVALLILAFLPATLKAQQEVTVADNLVYVKLASGLNGILMPIAQANNVEVTFYVQTGTMYEGDSVHGISNLLVKLLGNKVLSGLKSGQNQVNTENTVFSCAATSEHGIFKFITNSQNMMACIALMRDSVYTCDIYPAEINKTRNMILQEIEDAKHDMNKVFEARLLKGLFVQDHQMLETYGDEALLKTFDRNAALTAYTKYYAPNNTVVTITGNFANQDAEDAMVKIFKHVQKNDFNPETITKIVDIRPMTYNTQFIMEDTIADPEFTIFWQFPGTNNNFHESYRAFLLTAILNDKNNFIQVKAAKMGCKKFTVQYEANNFSGILSISFRPSRQNLLATYRFVMDEMGRLDKTLLNDVMISAAKMQFKKEYEAIKKSKDFPMWIARHWTFNDESYFPELLDSVMPLGQGRLAKFVNGYLNQSPHITGLRISKADRKALNVDSAFTDLDQSVGKYVFNYRQNVTSLEGDDNNTKLRNLLQWLTINPDVNVQVNGFSDEHEYRKATDEDSIITFMDSMPTFRKVTAEMIKHKNTVKPEMARSAKIVRYLYEHGIAAERITGTAMMYKSANKQEADDNLRCTITLNKVHKSPSLYEFHYGKKKE